MARIRTIKPEFPQSESVGRLTRDARLLFIQLWTLCDDSGRARAASRMLASLLYPYDALPTESIDQWLSELEREQCIERYVVDGSTYLQVVNWKSHAANRQTDPFRNCPTPRALASPLRDSSRTVPRCLPVGWIWIWIWIWTCKGS